MEGLPLVIEDADLTSLAPDQASDPSELRENLINGYCGNSILDWQIFGFSCKTCGLDQLILTCDLLLLDGCGCWRSVLIYFAIRLVGTLLANELGGGCLIGEPVVCLVNVRVGLVSFPPDLLKLSRQILTLLAELVLESVAIQILPCCRSSCLAVSIFVFYGFLRGLPLCPVLVGFLGRPTSRKATTII